MRERQNGIFSKLLERRISRSRLLGAGVTSAAIDALGYYIGSEKFTQKRGKSIETVNESELLRDTVEQRFNIEIRTEKEWFEELGQEYSSKDYSEEHHGWTAGRLQLLENILTSLPKHFYSPDENGLKLKIILEPSEGGQILRIKTTNYNDVRVGSYVFKSETSTLALIVLVHELVHRLTPYAEQEEEKVNTSPWFDKIDQILGVKFSEVNKHLQEEVKTKRWPLYDKLAKGNLKDREEQVKLVFYNFLHHGLLGDEPVEFIAVLGQTYILGKDYFFKMYIEFFSQERVEKLYNFVKQDIFKGKEYE